MVAVVDLDYKAAFLLLVVILLVHRAVKRIIINLEAFDSLVIQLVIQLELIIVKQQ